MTQDANTPPAPQHPKLCLPVMGEIVDTPDGEAMVQGVAESEHINWTPRTLAKVRAHTGGHPERFALIHVKVLASGKETTYPSWQVTRRQATLDRAPWREGLVAALGANLKHEP